MRGYDYAYNIYIIVLGIQQDDVDDIALLAHTPTQAEFLLNSLDQAASGIVLLMNSDKTEYMRFNKKSKW